MTESELPHDGQRPEAVTDLLGLLAYATLSAFFRLTDDAARAASLPDKVVLAGMAVDEYGQFQAFLRRLAELRADPEAAMRPYVAAFDDFHARTAPADWLEGLVKAYLGSGIAAGFYRAVAGRLDPPTGELVRRALAGTGHTDFIVERVRAEIESDPEATGRLTLWARRLLGEALSQAQRVAAERQPLARLLTGDDGGQLGTVSRMLAELADDCSRRLAALGLQAAAERHAAVEHHGLAGHPARLVGQ